MDFITTTPIDFVITLISGIVMGASLMGIVTVHREYKHQDHLYELGKIFTQERKRYRAGIYKYKVLLNRLK